MSHHTFTLNVKPILLNSGSRQSGFSKVEASAVASLTDYSVLSNIIKKNYWEDGMTTFTLEAQTARAQHIAVTEDALTVDLMDGRTISVPLAWYPRLLHGTPEERNNWRLIGNSVGIHWPDLDEDVSVENIVLGRPSGESQGSFQRWLDERAKQRAQP